MPKILLNQCQITQISRQQQKRIKLGSINLKNKVQKTVTVNFFDQFEDLRMYQGCSN